MSYWSGKRVVVTGGAGFIGSHVVRLLQEMGCGDVVIVRSKEHDLTREENVIRLLEETRPEIVFHLAGLVGGNSANKARPAEFFYRNLTMGTFMLHHSWRCGVRKFVTAGSGCSYPEHVPMPIREESFWDGLPQAESAPYSLAKRLLHIQALAYYRQYGFISVIGIPGNVYGPNDNLNPEVSHVVPALIRRFVEATEKEEDTIAVWGSDRPSRDFVYVDDVARGLLRAAEVYEKPELVNISSGVETRIRELVELLVELTGFQGRVHWDTSRPEGQLRRYFAVTKAQRELGFQAQVSLREGLERTVAWYVEMRESAGAAPGLKGQL